MKLLGSCYNISYTILVYPLNEAIYKGDNLLEPPKMVRLNFYDLHF